MEFANLLSKDAINLLLSDIVLVSSTGLVVPVRVYTYLHLSALITCPKFMKLIKSGWIRYYWTGVIIQHIFQAMFLGVAVAWTFKRSVILFLCVVVGNACYNQGMAVSIDDELLGG